VPVTQCVMHRAGTLANCMARAESETFEGCAKLRLFFATAVHRPCSPDLMFRVDKGDIAFAEADSSCFVIGKVVTTFHVRHKLIPAIVVRTNARANDWVHGLLDQVFKGWM